jgi:hypothetical protein
MTNRTTLRLVPLLLITSVLASCVAGPDPLRLAAEQQSLALAKQLAEGWFSGQPAPIQSDQQLVRDALADIERRLAVDSALLTGAPPPPPAPAPAIHGVPQ